MKKLILILGVLIIIMIGGMFFMSMSDVKVKQTRVTKEIQIPQMTKDETGNSNNDGMSPLPQGNNYSNDRQQATGGKPMLPEPFTGQNQ